MNSLHAVLAQARTQPPALVMAKVVNANPSSQRHGVAKGASALDAEGHGLRRDDTGYVDGAGLSPPPPA